MIFFSTEVLFSLWHNIFKIQDRQINLVKIVFRLHWCIVALKLLTETIIDHYNPPFGIRPERLYLIRPLHFILLSTLTITLLSYFVFTVIWTRSLVNVRRRLQPKSDVLAVARKSENRFRQLGVRLRRNGATRYVRSPVN